MSAPVRLRTIEEAAERLGVAAPLVWRLVASHQIAFVDMSSHVHSRSRPKGRRPRRTIRFLDADLDDFIRRRRVETEQKAAAAREPQPRYGAGVARRRVVPIDLPGADRYVR